MTYRQKTIISIVFSAMFFSFSFQAYSQVKKKPNNQKTVFENKQNYRPLSAYKSLPPPKNKSLDQLKSKHRKQIRALSINLKKNPDNINVRQSLAKQYFKHKMYKEVINTLLKHSHQIGTSNKFILAAALENRNMHKEQLKLLAGLSETHKQNYRVFYELGRVHYLLRDAESAIDALRMSIKLNNKHYPSYRTLNNIFTETQNNYENREIIKTIIRLFGEKPTYLTQLCRIYSEDNFSKEAIHYCNKAQRLNKSDDQSLSYLGLNYAKKDQQRLAKKALMNSAKKFKNSELAQWAAGSWFYEKQNYYVALEYFLSCIKADKNSGRCLIGAADSSFKIKKYEQALANYISACAVDQRAALTPFQVATSTLKQARDYEWSKKYDLAYKNCRLTKLKSI